MKKYNLIVLGGGAGGLVAAAGAAGFGAKVALVDPGPLGGDCLWTGCIPTKSLVHSAKMVHQAQAADEFQLQTTGKPSFAIAKDRLNQAIQTIQKHDDPMRFQKLGIDIYQSYGVFEGTHEIRVGEDEVIWGKRIVIATGSRPFIPSIKGLQEVDFFTNETILQIDEQPASLLVIGGGPIGLEFAQSFARFGTQVTVVETAPDILIREDREMVPYVKQALEKEGIRFITGSTITRVRTLFNQKEVTITKEGQVIQLTVDAILVATGRFPNIEKLQLQAAGIQTERGVISVNQHLQTTVPHIYAIGDVIGTYPFTHAAAMEGKAVVANAIFGLRQKVDYSHFPWVTYTDPQVFHLGLTEEEARHQVGKVHVYQTELRKVDRFIAENSVEGIVKVITDQRGVILGAHAVGPDAGDWMQEVTFAKRYGHKIGDLSNVIHPYPTRAGAIQQTADLFWREKLFSSKWSKIAKYYIRWFR